MNFVFFFPDEMRAESVSCYGHPLVKMPNFDRLAGEGVRFDQCHVQHPVCSPSRCSLMTGWYPHVSGHRTLWHLLQPHEPSLFKYLRQAGYHVEWFGKNDLYAQASFGDTVDRAAWLMGKPTAADRFKLDPLANRTFLTEPAGCGPRDTMDMCNAQAAMDFLRERKPDDKPFMLYLNLIMPHPLYVAPRPYHDMYDPDGLPPLRPAELDGKPDFHALIRQYRGLDDVPEESFRKMQAVYLGMNSYVDWILGQLLDTLEDTGLAQDTALFVFSDHGDWAGDYGLVEKWPSALDDTMTRVPLIIRAPGNKAGHVVMEQVELFDVMATTLELAGVEARHTHFAQSLVPQVEGAPGDPNRAVFSEGGYDTHEPHCFEGRWAAHDIPQDPNHVYYPKALQQQEHPESVCRATMIRTLTHKLIRRTTGVNELYDLEKDPQELRNVYIDANYAGVSAKLESRMLEWYIHTADAVPFDGDPRGLPPA